MDIFIYIIGIIMLLYWIIQIVFVMLHKKWTDLKIPLHNNSKNVSIIHPIKDMDFELEQNLNSWLNQNYSGSVEHIFSFQEKNDPAINIVTNFIVKNPEINAKIIINKVKNGLNGKSSNMVYGIKEAKYSNYLFVDSDIRVNKTFIQKMLLPLEKFNVGATTCGQVNIGGTKFWSRFFTYFQNNETIFNWALITKLGIPLGITGAAFAIKKAVLDSVGGLEKFGNSLLEDFHLGKTLTDKGYKLILGPFVKCFNEELEKEKSINYAKRLAVGIQTHIASQLPVFVFLLFWYWILLFLSLTFGSNNTIIFTLLLVGVRIIHGIVQKLTTYNKIKLVDLIIPLFYDWFATFFLTYFLLKTRKTSSIQWRGISYKVKKGGYMKDT